MEIQPASITQVKQGKDGRMVLVEDDVLAVARGLADIDPELRLRYSEEGAYFEVYYMDERNKKQLVLTSQELTPAILERVRQIQHPSYDYVAEMDRMDNQAKKDEDHRFHEETGEIGERLAHAVRKDLEDTSKIIVPKDAA